MDGTVSGFRRRWWTYEPGPWNDASSRTGQTIANVGLIASPTGGWRTVTSEGVDLVARAQRGDREAMRKLYMDTVESVTRFVSRRVPLRLVDDVVSETYTRALAGLENFRDRGVPVRAWLMRIAWNLIIDTSRSAAERTVPLSHLEMAASSRDPSSDWLERHDVITTLRAAFAALAPTQQVAVGLRHLEGFTVREVAAVLQISEAAVRALTYRGITALRHALTDHSSNDAEPQGQNSDDASRVAWNFR